MKMLPSSISLLFFILCHIPSAGQHQSKSSSFSFIFEDFNYRGFVDHPADQKANALVLLIPGSGKTDFMGSGPWAEWYRKLSNHFTGLGLAVCAWDKAGCGKSDGQFDPQQSVQSSATEALAAIEELRRQKIEGSDRIGLWGISRAGWICPLILQADTSIVFWISVSGVDSLENTDYLLRSNLLIEGRSEAKVEALLAERQEGFRLFASGAPFEAYTNATQNLQKDPFYTKMYGSFTKTSYEQEQGAFRNSKEKMKIDETSGRLIFFPGFRKVVRSISCPVLAVFGKKDAQIDWRAARQFYQENIGQESKATIDVVTLPDCNHLLMKCKTGGYFEDPSQFNFAVCDGYYEAMADWLRKQFNF